MARIIEICGSPGVGKSTIFKELEKISENGDAWETVSNKNPMGEKSHLEFLEELLSELKKGRRPINSRVSKLEDSFSFIKRIYRKFKLGRNFTDLYILKQAGERFVSKYPKYVDACWKNIFYKQGSSSNGMDLRFEKAEFIYLIMKKFQILMEKKDDKTFIIDEGLINMIDRGLYKSNNIIDEKVEIKDLLDTMPWPNGIVYLYTDLVENAKRIKYRTDIRDMHKGLTSKEIIEFSAASRQRIVTAIEYVKECGCPVLVLDSTESIRDNALRIVEFIKNEFHEIPVKGILQNRY
ncbi:hypothetical protein BC962_2220 [Gillisia mitskevichiae]|uniref:Thymidylate kinase n=1 Tax=Gillisia mitskevichiae TaxID=270921 RepID=A0A495PTL4_9FLAO|nr:hypothetical protein [Gillisia mitskevichiae]RKS53953.1 hypothetical protein BC962_2220 [Gillisia mitskevichiae]